MLGAPPALLRTFPVPPFVPGTPAGGVPQQACAQRRGQGVHPPMPGPPPGRALGRANGGAGPVPHRPGPRKRQQPAVSTPSAAVLQGAGTCTGRGAWPRLRARLCPRASARVRVPELWGLSGGRGAAWAAPSPELHVLYRMLEGPGEAGGCTHRCRRSVLRPWPSIEHMTRVRHACS